MKVAGIDGFHKRWVAIVLDDGRYAGAQLFRSIAAASSALRDAAVLAIDVPIGLPTGYGRAADFAAKQFIGPRQNSVFLTYPKAVFEAPTLKEGIEVARTMTEHGISPYSYALREKILEAEAAALADPRIIEVHPEVCFRAMADGPLLHTKKSWTGVLLRRRLLQGKGIEIPEDLGRAGAAGVDDVLDAGAAAWTAHRKASGEARVLPEGWEGPPTAGGQLPGVIWY
ncbi:MAG: DUF429 domain-containing protein [Vicinamibacteria bacterium]